MIEICDLVGSCYGLTVVMILVICRVMHLTLWLLLRAVNVRALLHLTNCIIWILGKSQIQPGERGSFLSLRWSEKSRIHVTWLNNYTSYLPLFICLHVVNARWSDKKYTQRFQRLCCSFAALFYNLNPTWLKYNLLSMDFVRNNWIGRCCSLA